MSLCSVCVWKFGVTFTYTIESIDSKLISVCSINDYSLIADLIIFVYGSAECATLFTRKYKGETSYINLNNFALNYFKWSKINQKNRTLTKKISFNLGLIIIFNFYEDDGIAWWLLGPL